MASATEGLFTPDQLRTLAAVSQRGAGAGVTTAWMFQGAGAMLFFVLFWRSRYVPRAVAGVGIVGSALLVAASAVMFVYPEYTNPLKLVGVPGMLAEIVTALWLLIRGLQPRAPR
jgi:hypothetical protein